MVILCLRLRMAPVAILIAQVLVLQIHAAVALAISTGRTTSSYILCHGLGWRDPTAASRLIPSRILPSSTKANDCSERIVINRINILLLNFIQMLLNLKELPKYSSSSNERYLLYLLHEHLDFILQYVFKVKAHRRPRIALLIKWWIACELNTVPLEIKALILFS